MYAIFSTSLETVPKSSDGGQRIATTILHSAYNFKCQPEVRTNLRGTIHYVCKLHTCTYLKGKHVHPRNAKVASAGKKN